MLSSSPAISLLEFSSVAAGTFAVDAMVKQAEVSLLRAGTVQPGKYLVLIAGTEADVKISHQAGIAASSGALCDEIYLAAPHEQLVAAVDGKRQATADDSLAVLETSHVAAILRGTDAALKGSLVTLVELRMGDGLGGKGVATLTGERGDVEAAIEYAQAALAGRDGTLCHSIVSRIDEALAKRIAETSSFSG
ncbi:MAG: BMC domain-containing protein [Phycisphaerales bacterium]|nr:BMC domain-containing protein [Phycisphaerales bacterium]